MHSSSSDVLRQRVGQDRSDASAIEQLPSGDSHVKNSDNKLPIKQHMFEDEQIKKKLTSETYFMLRKRASEAVAIKQKLNDDGLYVDSIRKTIFLFDKMYHEFKHPSIQLEIANISVQTTFINIIRGCLKMNHIRRWWRADGTLEEPAYHLVLMSQSVASNFSDVSDDFASCLANDKKYMETIKTILEERATQYLQRETSTLSKADLEIIESCLAVAHNTSMRPNCVHLLRKLNFTEVTKPYLNSEEKKFSLLALSTLAAIVTEAECDIINAARDRVQYLVDVLENGLNAKNRRFEGWSCKECAQIVRMLAQNDANKQLLVELGVLKLLVNMGRTANEEEQFESINAVWFLCFDKDAQQQVAEDQSLGLVELLFDLKTSVTTNETVRKACNGALWTLRDVLASSEYLRNRIWAIRVDGEASEEAEPEDNKEENHRGHIMISYQWDNQQLVKDIKTKLEEKHFKVWMDIYDMRGSMTQAMANGVEKAELVLICMSQKYKNSHFCRAEADYAFVLKKAIIPLLMEKDYRPDGWLGLISKAKLYYDFSGKYNFEEKMNALLRELAEHWNSKDLLAELSVQHELAKKATFTETADTVRKWTEFELATWIEKNQLKDVLPSSIKPDDIALLLQIRKESVDLFYRCAHDMLNISNLSSLSKLAWALVTIY